MNTVRMDNISWVDYERRVQSGAVVFLPIGATEQHGPHLPLGTDALLASAISEDVAREIDGIVAPALSYGYKSQPKCGGGQHFCGTTSVDGATLIAMVRDAVREFHRHGVKRLVLVIGHYENQWFVTEGIELAMRDIGANAGLEVMRLEHWEFVKSATLDKIFPGRFSGHRAGTCRGYRNFDDAALSPTDGFSGQDPESRARGVSGLRHVSDPDRMGAGEWRAFLCTGLQRRQGETAGE